MIIDVFMAECELLLGKFYAKGGHWIFPRLKWGEMFIKVSLFFLMNSWRGRSGEGRYFQERFEDKIEYIADNLFFINRFEENMLKFLEN